MLLYLEIGEPMIVFLDRHIQNSLQGLTKMFSQEVHIIYLCWLTLIIG